MPTHYYSRIFSIAGIVLGALSYWWLSSLALFAVTVVSSVLLGIYFDGRMRSLTIVLSSIALLFASGWAVAIWGWGYQFGAAVWCLVPVFALLLDSVLFNSRGDRRD